MLNVHNKNYEDKEGKHNKIQIMSTITMMYSFLMDGLNIKIVIHNYSI
jgi:hypothetical protein